MSKTLANKLSVSVSLLMFSFATQAAISADDKAPTPLMKADELMKHNKPKDTRAAVDILREFIRTHPDNVQAHVQLGAALAALVENFDYDNAILEEQQALKLDSKSFGARIILGHIYANLAVKDANKTDEAIKILKEACELKPTSSGAQRDLGITYLTAGRVDDAITAFKKSIELKPTNPEAHLKLSILLSKKGNFRDAIAEANDAVQQAGGSPDTHLALANILLESGDDAASVESFKSALRGNAGRDRQDPMVEANALSGLGWAIASNDPGKNDVADGILDERKAIQLSEKFGQLYPPFLPAYVRLAELLSKQDKNAEAESTYKAALKLSPDDAGVGTSYGKFLERIGRKDDARKALKKVLEKSPHFKPASDALAVLGANSSK